MIPIDKHHLEIAGTSTYYES